MIVGAAASNGVVKHLLRRQVTLCQRFTRFGRQLTSCVVFTGCLRARPVAGECRKRRLFTTFQRVRMQRAAQPRRLQGKGRWRELWPSRCRRRGLERSLRRQLLPVRRQLLPLRRQLGAGTG